MDFNQRLGSHLRRLRKQKGLSLLDVEAASGKEFKASVLGAYERGERAISAARLARLSELYRLPLRAMLPTEESPGVESGPAQGVAVDLLRLDEVDAPEGKALARYLKIVQSQRGEWASRVVSLRTEDVRALASALDRTAEDFVRRLDELGIRAHA